jgi:hypothetical protein
MQNIILDLIRGIHEMFKMMVSASSQKKFTLIKFNSRVPIVMHGQIGGLLY